MLELELQQYLLREYPQENARCEWKEYKNLKNSFCGDEKDDVISYVSAIANMEGGHLVLGVKDKTLEIVGTDISRLTFNGQPANTQSATFKLTEQCTYLSSEGLSIEEFVTDDTNKRVWIINIPKHLPRRPVLAHKKAWQRIEDSLVELTQERMAVILEESIYAAKDWSAEIVPDATIDDLDEVAIAKARMMFKKVHSRIPTEEVNAWDVQTFLSKCGLTRNGGITRAAIILLGKYESAFKLRPAVVQVTWTRRDKNQEVVVRIYGNEINKRYTDLLKTNDTLSLWDCISLDAVQKGRTIHEDIAQDLLKRGLIEGEVPHYSISLSIAKNTHQLSSYTKTKGLDKERLRQMVLQYLSNAGDEGAKRDSIYEYLKDVLPANKTEEQQLRMLGDLLKNMSKECLIKAEGRTWYTMPQS